MGLGVLGSRSHAPCKDLASACVAGARRARRSPAWTASPGTGSFAFLAGCDILVCLLPLTEATRGIFNASTFAALPRGARLLNVGRGGHLVEADLLRALETGQIDCAVLDVLAQEPPSPEHPLLRHPRVIVTPHIASVTHPEGAARRVLEQIRRHSAGEALADEVDRERGY